MKKVIIILIALAPLFSFSQNFEGGLLGGFSMAQIDGDAFGGYHKPGILIGGFVSLKFTKKIGTQFELKYIQKGSKKGINPKIGDYRYYHARLNYIEVPLLLNYYFKKKITFQGGLASGILMSAKEDFGDSFEEPDPLFNRLDISGVAGINYAITDKLSVSARYNYSIMPIRNHPGDQTYFLNRGQFNNVLTGTAYLKF